MNNKPKHEFVERWKTVLERGVSPFNRDGPPPTEQEIRDWLNHPKSYVEALISVGDWLLSYVDEAEAPADPELVAEVRKSLDLASRVGDSMSPRTAFTCGFALGLAINALQTSSSTRGARKTRYLKQTRQQKRRDALREFIEGNGPVPPKGPPRRQNPARTKYRQKFFQTSGLNVDVKTFDADAVWICANPT